MSENFSTLHLKLKGRIPSKKNSKTIICRGRYPTAIPSKNYKSWHTDAIKQLKELKIKKLKIDKPLLFDFTYYPPDRRRFDISNKLESVQDLLVDYGLLEDDNYHIVAKVIGQVGEVDRDNPRAEIELTYLTEPSDTG